MRAHTHMHTHTHARTHTHAHTHAHARMTRIKKAMTSMRRKWWRYSINTLVVHPNVKHRVPYYQACPLLDIQPREMKVYVHPKYVHMFRAAWFIIAKKWKQCLSVDGRISKCGKDITRQLHGIERESCYSMDEPWKQYAKWKELVTKDHILYE